MTYLLSLGLIVDGQNDDNEEEDDDIGHLDIHLHDHEIIQSPNACPCTCNSTIRITCGFD